MNSTIKKCAIPTPIQPGDLIISQRKEEKEEKRK